MRASSLLPAALLLSALAIGGADAQDFGGAFGGFDANSSEPIQIESDRLEVNDTDKVAIYIGNVRVRQGDTILEAPKLTVFYAGEPAADGSGPRSQVTRMEAGPGVTVRSGEQTATGDHIVFDMPNDLVTLEGGVVLTEGENVVRGERLVVNLTTKIGHVEGGRVQTLITPSRDAPETQ